MPINPNLYAALRAAFPADLERPALTVVDGPGVGLVYSWGDLERASAMLANLLQSLDLPARSRVAVQVEKSAEALLLYLATLRAGLVFVPLNTADPRAEMAHAIANTEPALVVCDPSQFGWVSKLAFTAGVRHVFTLGEARDGSLLERAAMHSDQHTVAQSFCDDLAAIICSSDTTGRSQTTMLMHGGLLDQAQALHRQFAWRADDVLLHALPVWCALGLCAAIHGAWFGGSPMLWLNRFDPSTVVACLPQATVLVGEPALYERILGEPAWVAAVRATRMRLFLVEAATLSPDTAARWAERTARPLLNCQGKDGAMVPTADPHLPDAPCRTAGAVKPR